VLNNLRFLIGRVISERINPAKDYNQEHPFLLIAYLDDNEAQNEKDSYRNCSGTGWLRYRSAGRSER
jgi:hypothetical protein